MKNIEKFNKIFLAVLVALPLLTLGSCKNDANFKVSGEIEGGADKSMVLEKSDFYGRWIPVDSVKINSSGKYSVTSSAPASPEIYRLRLDDRFIYFPVDSVENLTVNSSLSTFGSDFTVEGSEQAVNMAAFEKELMALDINDATKTTEFKRNVYNKYLKDSRGGIIGYYVLTKIVDGKPLYDPESTEDAKYYAAVATSFDQFRPNDPHVEMLKNASLVLLRKRNSEKGKQLMMHAQEITLIDVDLPDETGNNVKLSDIAKNGKPTVLIFSMMNLPESPALNLALSELYNKMGGRVDFYQVSLDEDQYAWREAARNLTWTTVIDPAGQTSDALRNYNVSVLPTFYIYNSAGSLSDRAESIADLTKKLSGL